VVRTRDKRNKNLPEHLYFDPISGYRFKLINNVRKSLGKDRSKAIAIANAYNAQMRNSETLNSLINYSVAEKSGEESLSQYLDKILVKIIKEDNPASGVKKILINDMDRAKKFFTMHPHDINIAIVTHYMEVNHKDCSNEIYNKKIGFLKKIFSWALDDGIMLSNPAQDKKRRKIPAKQRQRLTEEVYKAIYDIAPLWLKVAMSLSLQTTQARLEISRIRYRMTKPSSTKNGCVWFKEPKKIHNDIIYGEMYINRQKTIEKEESHVLIPIGQTLKTIIDNSRGDKIASPYIVHRMPIKICNKVSEQCDHITQLTPDYISKGFSKYRDKTGLCDHLDIKQRPTFHEVRALAARLFKDQGYDPQSRMAHSDAKSTKVYTKDHIRWVEVQHAEISI